MQDTVPAVGFEASVQGCKNIANKGRYLPLSAFPLFDRVDALEENDGDLRLGQLQSLPFRNEEVAVEMGSHAHGLPPPGKG
ncbi:hypothetical protein D9M68_1001210 [compost metagenome]